VAAPLRIGFIGAGANTRLRHIPGLGALEDVELVAVCNRSEESGRRIADEFGIARVTTEPNDIFAADDIDAVCIGTWPYRHREFVIGALEGGKHVLCEARMAMDAAEAREMLAAAQAHPALVAQLVPAPFDFGSWRTVRRLVQEGALGDLREVHVTSLNGNGLAEAPLHWREQQRYSGTNTMILGILAEIVGRWVGPTERVFADAEVYVKERVDPETGETRAIDVPDSLGIFARLAGGARATFRLSTVTASPPEASGITLYGSRATLAWKMGDTMTLAPVGGAHAPLEPDAGTTRGWEVEADFVRSIREGASVELTSFEDGVAYMRFTEAVARSWREARPVDLAEV
jgi:predicted dehydrogenase